MQLLFHRRKEAVEINMQKAKPVGIRDKGHKQI
jgi:hypothetical protein